MRNKKSFKTAVIVHGGAMKGAFAAGVLYGLSRIGVKTADLIMGASSSAATAAYFVGKQYDSIKNIWIKEVGTKKFIKYENFFTEKSVFDFGYLINTILKQKYSLNVRSIKESESLFLIPAYNFKTGKFVFWNNRQEKFAQDFWYILQSAMAIHDTHLVQEKGYLHYADAELNPYGIYRDKFIPKNWNVLMINNHQELGVNLKKRLGLMLFMLLQSKNFPIEAKTTLRKRNALIKENLKCFEKFINDYQPLLINPPTDMKLDGINVVARDSKKLKHFFHIGEKTINDIAKNSTMKEKLKIFIERSDTLLSSKT